MALKLNVALGDYDRTRPLADGRVTIPGVDLEVTFLPSPVRHWRILREQAFDAGELSMASFMMAHERGFPYVGLPIFPHRRFRHSFIFVGESIREPADLVGARVGSRTYQNTTSVWVRGILQDDYGIDLTSLQWFTQDEDDVPLDPELGASYTRMAPGETDDELLQQGRLEAVVSPHILRGFLERRPNVRRLFPDFERVEREYYERTGHFPIMHTFVLRQEIYRREPWLAEALYDAFEKAKALAYEELEDPRRSSMIWAHAQWERERALLGDDPWVNGLEANRATLDTLARYAVEQGLIRRRPDWSKLFAPVG